MLSKPEVKAGLARCRPPTVVLRLLSDAEGQKRPLEPDIEGDSKKPKVIPVLKELRPD